jgi:hypothetical protein
MKPLLFALILAQPLPPSQITTDCLDRSGIYFRNLEVKSQDPTVIATNRITVESGTTSITLGEALTIPRPSGWLTIDSGGERNSFHFEQGCNCFAIRIGERYAYAPCKEHRAAVQKAMPEGRPE